ncbi:tetratricopeptide repeat protein [Rickettsia felis]|uniref:tetratricopeptide repeat protein n=1 Tax=Rickettsia felis TaxID=42862 RepID=UPI000694ACEA|nr:tetratricopeptide repeat protein [Rickettsia felis]
MKKRNEQEAFKLLTSGQLLALYRSYSRAGELKYASPVLEYLLESTYSDAERYFEKAVVLKEILRTEEALEACDKAIELKPDYAAAYDLNGRILYRPWKYEEAIKAFDKVIELNPDFQDVYLNKGWCLTEIGRYEEAVECFNIGIKKNQCSEELYASKAWVLLQELNQKDEEALQAYKKAIELSPKDNIYYFFAAQILKALGGQKEAKVMLNKAIELAPNMEECILYCFKNDDFDYVVTLRKRECMKLTKAYFRE